VLATTITAIGLTLVLTFPAPILQTMPPGVADNPVRGADATVAWIVASGRDRSPTFEALVRRVAELNAAVIVCWSGHAARSWSKSKGRPAASARCSSSSTTSGRPKRL
jgi:hypothetical protein